MSANSIINTVARDGYDLAFQISPIILTGGELGPLYIPIIALQSQQLAFAQGALTSGQIGLEDFYARYLPIPGGTVINNTIGSYPFANRQVASNAIIEQPKNISLRMIAPVRDLGGYMSKLAIFTSLQKSLEAHNRAGGTYIVMTPSFIYTDCVFLTMTDITGEDTNQKQVEWQLDFIKPLISSSDALAAFGRQMGAIAGGGILTTSAVSGIA